MATQGQVDAVLKGIETGVVEVSKDKSMPGNINLTLAPVDHGDIADVIAERYAIEDGKVVLIAFDRASVYHKANLGSQLVSKNNRTIIDKVTFPTTEVMWCLATGEYIQGVSFKDGTLDLEERFQLSNLITSEGEELDVEPAKPAKKAKKGKKKKAKAEA